MLPLLNNLQGLENYQSYTSKNKFYQILILFENSILFIVNKNWSVNNHIM